MKALKIMIVMLVLVMSVAAVCAGDTDSLSDDSPEILNAVQEDITTRDTSDILKTANEDICTAGEASFTNLTDEIAGKDSFYLNQNYKFNNATDNADGILINRDGFVLDGNGHTIDGDGHSRIFQVEANDVTLKNLVLINGNSDNFGAILTTGTLTLDNITFINNSATGSAGAVGIFNNITLNIYNSRFIDNYAADDSPIYVINGILNMRNTNMTSSVYTKGAQIMLYNATGIVENSIFSNMFTTYAPAIYVQKSQALRVINSKFLNLKANITAGAIGVKVCNEIYITGCEFTNVTSSKNAGAILVDIAGDAGADGLVTITDSLFRNLSSGFGGAYMQYGGKLILNNTEFTDNHATYNGGSLYLSFVDGCEIKNTSFTSNGVEVFENYSTYGGAIFMDSVSLNMDSSKFSSNTAGDGNAIYAYDTSYTISNSTFKDNKNAIFSVFDVMSDLDDGNIFNDDTVITNQTFYATIMVGEGLKLTLLDNRTINVTTIPSSFDLRDYGWVSSVKNQGWMGACWTFGMCGVLESALLKSTGMYTDFSENNMQNTMLKYSIYGSSIYEGGANLIALGYLLSWLGAFSNDADSFDELGKISPVITTGEDVHVQDVIFTPNNEVPYATQLKLAIMKYGSIDTTYFGQSTYNEQTPYYNPETYAQYVNDDSINPNHDVSIIGWDDNFSASNFGITPPGDGAWIVKNSWGTNWGNNGFLYVSYYDKSLLKSSNLAYYATSIILENTEPYNKNYQYDLLWGGDLAQGDGNVSYYNVFESLDDDLIAAVGTYFTESGINYTVEIFVNDELKSIQTGVSPYCGYHTIKLDKYIPVKRGDVFKAVVTSNAMPYTSFADIRVHYTDNISFVYMDGEWKDCYDLDGIACLKIYTVADNTQVTDNRNVTADYASGSYFTVKVTTADGRAVGAGEAVNFTVNGKTITALTDDDGIAGFKINYVPGTYEVITSYKGKTYNNTVNVKLNPSTCKITQNKNIKVDYTVGKYFTVKIVSSDGKVAASGVNVKFTIAKLSKTVKTNKDGIAKIKITQVPKKYTIKTTFNKKSVKNTVVVKHVLKAKKVTVKKTAKKFSLKTTLKINGKLVKGKVIKFKFNGKTYKVKTNKKGIAQKTLDKKVIKKLKKGKNYAVKVTYLKDTIKTTVKVK